MGKIVGFPQREERPDPEPGTVYRMTCEYCGHTRDIDHLPVFPDDSKHSGCRFYAAVEEIPPGPPDDGGDDAAR